MSGLLVVLSGPSGVGKGTVRSRVLDRLPGAALSISVTTRDPRADERDGVDYHFVDDDRFDRLIADDALLEWAEFAGNRYGTPRAPVLRAVAAGGVVLLEIEVQGALQVVDAEPDALTVFLAPPDLDELERRLRGRGTEDEEALHRRLSIARDELAAAARFDTVVVNDDPDRAAAEVTAAIASARQGPAVP